jgi:uncharacterized DUF497 family protein
MKCTWDPRKHAANLTKHGLGFDEAARLFDLPAYLILEEYDADHSEDEDRIRSIGPIARGVIVVISVELDDETSIRIISARFATASERRRYAEMIAGEHHE